MFSIVFNDMTITVPAVIWNRAKIEEISKYRTPGSVDVIIKPDVQVVYLSHRRRPSSLVTLTLPGALMPRAWFPSGGTSGGSCESAGGEADWG